MGELWGGSHGASGAGAHLEVGGLGDLSENLRVVLVWSLEGVEGGRVSAEVVPGVPRLACHPRTSKGGREVSSEGLCRPDSSHS